MAELIHEKDSLNDGRKKLNEAIKDSDKALTDSQQALLKAVESMNLSERTQKELNEAILEGDSSPLAGQLSVGADSTVYDGPQERLIAEYEKTNRQLADKVDQAVFNKTESKIFFYGDNKELFSIDITEASNFNAVQEYIDSLVSDGFIEGITLADESVTRSKLSIDLQEVVNDWESMLTEQDEEWVV